MSRQADTSFPLVAIVTPVYNGEAYLAETMESVQNQTYPNLVHVVLDNASTDGTAAIIASFQNGKVPLIVARNDKLLRMDDNWNESLKLIPADAVYFTVVCADDAVLPESTARMIELAESDPEITVLSTDIFRNGERQDFHWPRDRNVFDGKEAITMYFDGRGTIEGRQMLMRTNAIALDTPFFDERVIQASDMDVFLRLAGRGKFGFVHEPLMKIRDHDNTEYNRFTRPLNLHFCAWLINMQRHGPAAFGKDAFRAIHRRYTRHYLRRMLVWRWRQGNSSAFTRHVDELAKLGQRPALPDFADALIDWGLIKLGLRKGWHAYPY